jgi:hypothetical protein
MLIPLTDKINLNFSNIVFVIHKIKFMKYIFLSLVLIFLVKAELLIRKLERCECASLLKSDCDT